VIDLSGSSNSKSLIKKNCGFTLVGVLMVLVVLSVLGMSIISVASNSMKTSVRERDDQSVFYIAEAGIVDRFYHVELDVKKAFETINMQYNSLNAEKKRLFNFEGKFYTEVHSNIDTTLKKLEVFERSFGEQPQAEVMIIPIKSDGPLKYKVKSIGTIGSKSRTVEQEFIVNFEKGETGVTLPTGGAIYSVDGMQIKNGTIEGNLVIGSNTSKGIEISGWPDIKGKIIVPKGTSNNILKGPPEWIKQKAPQIEEHNEFFEYPYPPFPNFPVYPLNPKVDKNGNLSVGTLQTISLTGNSQFNNINFSSDAKLTLDIGSKDTSIVVNKIAGGGHLDVKGTGSLTIYIKDNIDLTGHFNQTGSAKVLVYLGPSANSSNPKTLKSSEYGEFKASIFAKDANLELVGSGKIVGNIITGGNSVKLSGDTSGAASSGYVVYAPSAAVNLSGSGKLVGSVISRSFEISGGGKVTAKDMVLNDIPFFFGGSFSGSSSSPNNSKINKLPLKEISK
ncbi:MAG: PilX N-terminal domain-containing pilus assembly protein, partial [Sporosarcina sp.]